MNCKRCGGPVAWPSATVHGHGDDCIPYLLATITELCAVLERICNENYGDLGSLEEMAARAALAKARGEAA